MKNMILKTVANVAMKTANSNKQKHSLLALYQPQMPEQLKKSDK